MDKTKLFIGKNPLKLKEKEVKGEYTDRNGEDFFVIKNYDKMRPFFMTIVSASDHWLFISSNGGLSAGRKNPANAIFPYYTDDKIIDSAPITGHKAILHIEKNGKVYLWEPFKTNNVQIYQETFNLYKNREGNKLIFESINHDLNIKYCYGWMFSNTYGIVKKSWIENDSEDQISIDVLDGIQNIMPSGVDSMLQDIRSTLVNAYKRSELKNGSKVAIYSLSSMIVDKAEPSEALKASIAWHCGIEAKNILLSSLQVKKFRDGFEINKETDIKAENGAYFLQSNLTLESHKSKSWSIVCDVNQSAKSILELNDDLSRQGEKICEALDKDIESNKAELRKKIGLCDGIQRSKDRISTGRHFTNVLFNIMRGGTFDEGYQIETKDFLNHVKNMNIEEYKKHEKIFNALPKKITYHQLRYFLLATDHISIFRFYLEYLPLSFSRRHGDPSRPWNHFSIDTQDKQGNKLRNFEGNWRDIFQNWEALSYSYPEYTLSMISKFVNASTIDGYNPYRITRDGIDWETIDPSDPWSHIGYWGDHQIIYLSKFVEFSMDFHPVRLKKLLNDPIFTYANVPYRIKGYDAIVSDPKNTIDFSQDVEKQALALSSQIGSDGKLVWNHHKLEQVNLTEKLLLTVLTKLYNFIPDGGIWLNTQRPEWNDANNALVGNGLSVVTLCYLKRFVGVLSDLFRESELQNIQLNKPVIDLMEALKRGFKRYHGDLEKGFSSITRREFMDDFGIAGEHYRTTAYAGFTGEKRTLEKDKVLDFFALANEYMEATLKKSKREDGLYHAYNLIKLKENTAEISYLYEMLEGQVAILSAKQLNLKESVEVLDALKSSAMFRPDQYSYMLYPDRDLPYFMEKNHIPSSYKSKFPILQQLVNEGDLNIVEQDEYGNFYFNSDFNNSKDFDEAIEKIEDLELRRKANRQKKELKQMFEDIFKHHEFTGRSGSFYGYEGLGSIYWHMVSKLLLCIQENLYDFRSERGGEYYGRMVAHYYEVRAGIGVDKSPELYGAFPTDAYSHTPKNAGAKQPGMTGQVKEDIINRWAELGVTANRGKLKFEPFILRKSELIEEDSYLSFIDFEGNFNRIDVQKNSMAFTYCQIPVIYHLSDKFSIILNMAEGDPKIYNTHELEEQDSKDIFKRKGKVKSIKVNLTADFFI